MSLSRRDFFKRSAALGGGVAIGIHLTGCGGEPPYPGTTADELRPNAFLQVRPDGVVVFQLPRAEMGQGVYTGLTTLAAEELNLPATDIVVEHAYYHPDFRDPEFQMMMTGGSVSLRNNFTAIRQAGANLRELMRQAAAKQWGGGTDMLSVENGMVYNANGDSFSFAELVETARNLTPPEAAPLKSAEDFTQIGRDGVRLDALAKVTGTATFGIDCNLPGSKTAVMRRCPHLGGRVKSFDDSGAKAIKGVSAIFETNGGVAVVADGYWAARKAADALDIIWDKGPLAGLDEKGLRAHHTALLKEEGRNISEEGDAALATGERFEVTYQAPMLSHSPMEPPNALVNVVADRVEIWTGTQVPDTVIGVVAAALERPREQIVVHNQMLGGGFGRRLVPDYIVEAARISEKTGTPIKMVWSREDDIQHDYYRPAATTVMAATLDKGKVTSITAKTVVPSIMSQLMPMFAAASMPEWLPPAIPRSLGGLLKHVDSTMAEGISHTDYRFPYMKVDAVHDDTPIPVGFWRSVGHSQNAFFTESFIDELAHRVGEDPVAFRMQHMPTDSKRYGVLKMAAEKASWGQTEPGQYQGVAAHESFHTSVAQVVTASVENGAIRVHKVVCVVDCGLAVNPDVVKSQMESGIVFGLTAALKSGITLEDGRVMQSNFHDYPMLTLAETPEIEIHIMPSQEAPTGVGEPGLPPVAPALANAVFAATGQRLRDLPLKLA
ncbi:CO/xanthine dehydrogenase Mo-binding subunit [Litorivivens lipolytica]|uniref:CO/xanthine dehydrogenase Mo-binding subunit n=1 Tax=Litorivivens lipolytica TaxID=1524264 RepID=A0A7W4Z4Q4_9GAMM|nr:molybdopterin cofactor-binding domain-containing protein [Litorivivens lipolytica]MBB3046322.1 CO/xanthine dehydrogenase Mo-binding subunit [Litorivivens lipolytica]